MQLSITTQIQLNLMGVAFPELYQRAASNKFYARNTTKEFVYTGFARI